VTVVVLTVSVTAADGFWATALRGAVGSIDAAEQPLRSWLQFVVVMLPLVVAAVLGGLLLADRLFRRARGAARLAGAVALVVVLTTAVGVGRVAVAAASDYRAQSSRIAASHTYHDHRHQASAAAAPGCTGACAAKEMTLAAHKRAIGIIALVILLTNATLVLWLLAMRGGRVWASRTVHAQSLR
jgi:hypothetical protein